MGFIYMSLLKFRDKKNYGYRRRSYECFVFQPVNWIRKLLVYGGLSMVLVKNRFTEVTRKIVYLDK